jgi:hypothetical protein
MNQKKFLENNQRKEANGGVETPTSERKGSLRKPKPQ